MILAALLLVTVRLADVITTRLVTPDLRFERNPIARRIGWGGIIFLNVICVPVVLWIGGVVYWAVVVASAIAAAWNLFLWLRYVKKIR